MVMDLKMKVKTFLVLQQVQLVISQVKIHQDTLAEGMSAQDVKDFQAAAVAAGAGQRVNPGFFDSRNIVDPDVIAAAREH